MKKFLFVLLAVIVLAVGVSPYLRANIIAWVSGLWEKPKAVVVQEQVRAEWQSVKATQLTAQIGQIPGQWDASLFVGTNVLERMSKCYEGLQIQYDDWAGVLSGATVTVTAIDLKPAVGDLEALITVTGRSAALNLTLNLQIDAIARFVGTIPAEGLKPASAQFKWMPLSVRPGADWNQKSVAANGFAAKLLAETAAYLAKPDRLVFTVPVQQNLSARIGLATPQQDSLSIPDTNGSINFSESMPQSTVEPGLATATPIFAEYGVWLLSKIDQAASLPAVPDVPNLPIEELQQQISEMRADLVPRLAAANPGPVELSVFASTKSFNRLIASLASVPPPNRTLTVQVTSHTGRLAQKVLHDDVLGNIDAFAEIKSDGDTRASIMAGNVAGTWSHEGLQASVPVNAHLNASIHFHVTPPISGGIGTVVGILGDASQVLSVSAKPLFVKERGLSIAGIMLQPQCENVPITATTDGVLKVDFGWMSVPKVGVKMSMPVFNGSSTPRDLVDSRPHFISILPEDSGHLRFTHNAPFAKLVFTPTGISATDAGLRLDASVAITPILGPATSARAREVQADIEREADAIDSQARDILNTQNIAANCPPPPSPELIVGDILIGPNNEIVKFLVHAVNDVVNGPGDSNDAVKAGYYAGSVLHRLNPGDQVVQSFLSTSQDAAKTAFGENSAAYSTVARANQEVRNVLDNPVRETMNLPKNTLQAVKGFGNTVGDVAQAVTHPSVTVTPSQVNVQVGNNGVNVNPSQGKANVKVAGICIGFGC